MPTVRQVTFEAGELADKMYGRTDSPLYAKGLRKCRNFFPGPEGQLISRPGSTFVAETKGSAIAAANPGSAANTKVRLIKFVFSGGQHYVLLLGDRFMRFFTNGGVLESAPGVPLELVTPWSWSSLPSLQFAQVGNIMVLTHPGYDAQQLERLSNVNWTLTPYVYTPRAWPGLPLGTPAPNPFAPGTPLVQQFMSDPMIEVPTFPPDSAHPAREWQFALTVLGQDLKTGKRFESLPFLVTAQYNGVDTFPLPNGTIAPLASNNFSLYSDAPVVISAMRVLAGLSTIPDFRVLGINLYRGRGGLFGFVMQTLTQKFIDVGQEPNYGQQPPLGTNPFAVYDQTNSLNRIEKPMSVAFFGDRLVFGGAYDNDKLARVATLFFSALGQWNRFDPYLPPIDTMALQFALAVTTRQEIRTMYVGQKLLIGTDSGVHSLWGAQGAPLAASVIPDVRQEAAVGCSNLRMLGIGAVVLMAEGGEPGNAGADGFAPGLAVHALVYNSRYGFYQVNAVSEHASHLFYGDGGGVTRTLVDWDYAKKPFNLIWAVRGDGVMLSASYSADGVVGWARHDTDGLYENVCTVREGNEDAVYTVVNRTVNGQHRRYVERMTSRAKLGGSTLSIFGTVSQPPDDICIDAAKPYVGAPTTHLSQLDYLEGKSVWVLREGMAPLGPYVVTGGSIDIITPTPVGKPTYVGLLFRPEMETLAVGGPREKQKTLRGLLLEVKDTRGLRAGPSLDPTKLLQVKQLAPATGYGPITNETKMLRVATLGDWDEQARAAVVQDLPLPATIVGLTRDVSMGDGSQP